MALEPRTETELLERSPRLTALPLSPCAVGDLDAGESPPPVPRLGQHTDEWRAELGF